MIKTDVTDLYKQPQRSLFRDCKQFHVNVKNTRNRPEEKNSPLLVSPPLLLLILMFSPPFTLLPPSDNGQNVKMLSQRDTVLKLYHLCKS